MASKYASLKTKLPAFEEESSYQQKIDEEKKLILAYAENAEDVNVAFLAARLEQAKQNKDEIEERLYGVNVQIEALSQLLITAMDNQSLEKVSLSSGATVYLNYAPYPSVEDREKLFAWIKKQRMVKLLTVNHQTLKGLVNELLANGKSVPPGVNVFLKTSARLLRGRNGDV